MYTLRIMLEPQEGNSGLSANMAMFVSSREDAHDALDMALDAADMKGDEVLTELDPYSGNIEHLARAYGATHKEDTYAVGVIVGYCPVPSYAIRRYDGTEFWWRADLVEVSDEVITKNDNRYPDRAKSGSHYIIYESDIAGAVGTREAVCYCGARFASKMAVTGTIGEMFASHIRQLRVREVADAEEARRRAERFGKNEDN